MGHSSAAILQSSSGRHRVNYRFIMVYPCFLPDFSWLCGAEATTRHRDILLATLATLPSATRGFAALVCSGVEPIKP